MASKSKAKKTSGGRSRNMMYAQKFPYLKGDTKEEKIANIIELIETKMKPTPEKYAVIVHDKEVDKDGNAKEPDLHVMMRFKNTRYYSGVAKDFGDKPQYIEGWDDNEENGFAYLVHATAKARKEGKHLYDTSEVHANFDYVTYMADLMAKANRTNQQGQSVNWLLDGLYAVALTKQEIEKKLSGSQYGRLKRQIDDIWTKRLQIMAAEWRKQMLEQGKKVEVIWIYGEPGAGKTRLAKRYADKAGQAFYLSGSSRDPFQGYLGQHTIILDELRPQTIEYHDLLRITDPFGVGEAVAAPSRYYDKALAADLIIITSPYSPEAFYYKKLGAFDMIDKFEQLARRISIAIRMTMDKIEVLSYDSSIRGFSEIPNLERKNPYSQTSSVSDSSQAIEMFNSIFD